MHTNKHQPLDVDLRIRCRNLKDADLIGKSDPYVKVELVNDNYKTIQKLGKTEQIENELNPQFSKTINVKYLFQKKQLIGFFVKDDDDGPGNSDDNLGKAYIPLGELVQAGTQGVTRRLKGKGEIIVTATQNTAGAKFVKLRARGEDLDKKDFFGKSDPFYELYINDLLLIRSNVIKNQTHPTWQQQEFSASMMQNAHELVVKVYDWDEDSSNDLIGIATIPMTSITPGAKFPLINPKKKYKKKKTNSGLFIIDFWQEVEVSSFYDLLQSGLELNFHCAVDFTGSNGKPSDPRSLHHVVNGRTKYSDAIYSVGQVIEPYDFDKRFSSYGFGGFINRTKTTEHVFPLDQRTGNSECQGVMGIIQAYLDCFHHIQLSGPTNFSPVIKTVSQAASQSARYGFYHVLMILTDGAITDMSETLRAIKTCEGLPMSIIIIGIGDADFSSMEELDGDGDSKRKRDLVQFVALNDVNRMMGYGGGHFSNVNELLAGEVLAELPKQVELYFRSSGASHKQLVRRAGMQPPYIAMSEQEAQSKNAMNQQHHQPAPQQHHQQPPQSQPVPQQQAPPAHQAPQAPYGQPNQPPAQQPPNPNQMYPNMGQQAPPMQQPHAPYGAPPPQQGGYGMQPQQGYGMPPQQPGYGMPPMQQQPPYGMPPQQGYGMPMPPQQGYGAPNPNNPYPAHPYPMANLNQQFGGMNMNNPYPPK